VGLVLAGYFFLFCLLKKINKQNTKVKELERELELEHKIEEQKDKINTGDNNADFNATIDLLQKYSERRSN
jgi:hypothetical protein